MVAHEVYGEEAVRVTPPSRSDLLILNNHLSSLLTKEEFDTTSLSSVNLTVGQDDVEGPNGECPPVSFFTFHSCYI